MVSGVLGIAVLGFLASVSFVYALFLVLAALPLSPSFSPLLPFSAPDSAQRGKKNPKVSVIVVTRNEAHVIGKTLRELRKSSYKNMEIILVDSSTDDTRKRARPFVHRIVSDKGKGKAQALNLGVRAASGTVLYFLDADTLVEKNTIETLVGALERADASVGVLEPVNKAGLVSRIGRLQYAILSSFSLVSMRLIGSAPLPGKNFAIRRNTLRALGNFQPSLAEDINLSVRLVRARKRVAFVNARVREQVPEALGDFLVQQQRWFAGGIGEMRFDPRCLPLAVLLPAAFPVLFAPALSFGYLAAYAMMHETLPLVALALGAMLYCLFACRLEKDDVLLLPVTFVAYAVLQIAVLLIIACKLAAGKNIAWVPTKKKRY